MKKLDQIDATDRMILDVLQREGDVSHAALAERVGASTASCWRRIRALEEAGVIGPAVRLVNPQAIGRGVDVLCHVRMKSHDLGRRKAFEAFVDQHNEIVECFSMTGEWDYLLRVVVADVAGYERFLMRELLTHASVATASSHFALGRVKYTTALPL
jgi:Lrp/AsnC family transcriptional regulator